MELAQQLLDIESHLIDESLLVFPETGVITRRVAVDAMVAAHAEGRPSAEVPFDDVRSMRLTDEAALVTYKVAARWAYEGTKNVALASSVYVKRDDAWKLACHQQTPLTVG